jgi:hypothetical protein
VACSIVFRARCARMPVPLYYAITNRPSRHHQDWEYNSPSPSATRHSHIVTEHSDTSQPQQLAAWLMITSRTQHTARHGAPHTTRTTSTMQKNRHVGTPDAQATCTTRYIGIQATFFPTRHTSHLTLPDHRKPQTGTLGGAPSRPRMGAPVRTYPTISCPMPEWAHLMTDSEWDQFWLRQTQCATPLA